MSIIDVVIFLLLCHIVYYLLNSLFHLCVDSLCRFFYHSLLIIVVVVHKCVERTHALSATLVPAYVTQFRLKNNKYWKAIKMLMNTKGVLILLY